MLFLPLLKVTYCPKPGIRRQESFLPDIECGMRFTWRGRISGTDYEAQIPSPQRNNGVNLRLTLTMSETGKETPVTRNRKEECLNSEKRGR